MEEIWNATGMGETISHTTRYDSMADVSAVIGAAGALFTIDLSGFARGHRLQRHADRSAVADRRRHVSQRGQVTTDNRSATDRSPSGRTEPLEVARLFDAMADSYDEVEPWYEHLYKVLHTILLKHLAPPDDDAPRRSLDAGCGTGLQTALLEALGYESHGVDISSGLLARAKSHLKRSTLIVGDLQRLPYPDSHFDVVNCCGSTLSFVSDPARAINEMGRVLRPGGKLLLECEHKWSFDLGWSLLSALTFDSLGYDVTLGEIARQLWRPAREGFLLDYPFPLHDGRVEHMKLRLFTVCELDDMLGLGGLVRRQTWGIHTFTNLIPSTTLHRDHLGYPVDLLFRQLCKIDHLLFNSPIAHALANSIVLLAERTAQRSPGGLFG